MSLTYEQQFGVDCSGCNESELALNRAGLCADCTKDMDDDQYRRVFGTELPDPIIQHYNTTIEKPVPSLAKTFFWSVFFSILLSAIISAVVTLGIPLLRH